MTWTKSSPRTYRKWGGAPLGVEEELKAPHGVLARKEDFDDYEGEDHRDVDNYPSAEGKSEHLWNTYKEEEAEGMTEVFETIEKAAECAGCDPDQLVFGALGVKDESTEQDPDKFRTIHDDTLPGPNKDIKDHIDTAGQCPRSTDLSHAVAVEVSEEPDVKLQ